MRKLTLITTGGTIEKVYDEDTGELTNRGSIVRRMLRELHLEETRVEVIELISKDSLEMTEVDRERIVEAVAATGVDASRESRGWSSGVVVLHGTDTLSATGERLHAALHDLRAPVVLTGAMRPFEMKSSDALQNLTEALFAVGVLPPGVYAVAHGRALPFPGVVKNPARGTFIKS